MYRAKHNTQTGEDWRKLPPTEQVKYWKRDPNTGFNPTRYAGKALAVGTVLCLSVTGAAAFVLGRAMGVSSVYEFAEKVREWAPRKRRELEGWLGIKPNKGLEEERRRIAKMGYEEEMEYWGKVVMVEEEGGGGMKEKKENA